MTAREGVIVSHPTMNANVREAAGALADAGLLAELHTSFAVGPRADALARRDPRLFRMLGRRRVPDEVAPFARSHPAYEIRKALAGRYPGTSRLLGQPSLHGMYASFDSIAAHRLSDATTGVLGYEDGARDTFAAASARGLPRIYDLPIPFWQMKHDLLEAEAAANPAWAPLLGGLTDSDAVLERKTEELLAADLVLTASTLSTASVRSAAPDKTVAQITYGCPPPASTIRPAAGGPLRVLYVGSLTQRKGISYLFDAMTQLGDAATLTVVGRGAPASSAVLNRALAEHDHISSVPNQLMAATMRSHDVLVLPSIVEGFGLVILEALSQGLPVIATARTGAVDLVDEETADWIVPAGDSVSIATRLDAWARDADALDEAKTAALGIARRNPWDRYRAGVRTAVAGAIGRAR